MFKRILLPVDPARQFGAANQYAVDLAHHYGCSLVATYVIDERLLGHVGGEAAATLDSALEWVGEDAMEDFVQHHTDLSVQKSLAYGHTPTALFQMVLQSGADVVVVGGYHSTAAPQLWGSTVADVVHHVERPTFVVRKECKLPEQGQRIVVPYDDSERAASVLPRIATFAAERGAELELVYVAKPSAAKEGEGILKRGVQKLSEYDLPIHTALLRRTIWRPKWRTILSHAHALGSPLIALSRLGETSMRTGRSKTVDHLVAHGDVAVWVVRR